MSTLTSLARAQARTAGVAQRVATVRHVHLSDRPMVFIPLALAGEANAPLAALLGDDPATPRLLVVSQPRNRAERFAFAAELARVIVPYAEGFATSTEQVPVGRGEIKARSPNAPQLVLPNQAGIGFTRLLGRSTRFRRPDGDYPVDPAVPVLGRWLSFLAERTEHPGSCLMLAVTEALALHWASGQSELEDRNLATLLAWIDPPSGVGGAAAARAGEDPVTWPPAGPATDPGFDNEVLAPLIEACARAVGDGEASRRRARTALERALTSQLMPTWRLTWRAIELLRSLPEGGHVAARWDADRDAFTGYAAYLADGGVAQPRRDGAVAAARRLNWLERAQASYAAQRAFDDPLVMAEYRMSGETLAGTVVAAQPGRVAAASGKRRVLRPWITVSTEDPVLILPETVVTSASRPGQKARLVSVSEPAGNGPSLVVLELSGGMGRSLIAAPGSVPEVGERTCYTTLTDDYQPIAEFPSAEQTPWTHGGPPVPYEPADEPAVEDWS
ncbi:MAG: hypothetical protein ACRDOK_05320 [Streptosporangiaceae bacterium]